MASRIEILDFLFDDENEEKLWAHGLTLFSLLEVLEHPHMIRRNRKDRRGLYLVVGRDARGRCIAIPVEPTHVSTTWRPVTAWICKRSEEVWCP